MKTKQMKKNNLIKTAIFSLMLFVGNIAMAQSTISGSISDSDQQPLPGVNVVIEELILGLPQILMVISR